jgi:tetratricopeptide (TPR) repeat protein
MKLRFFALIPLLTIAVPASAAEPSRVERVRSLAINRALLAAFESEYTDKLKEKGVGAPSKKREMTNLKYKIEALNEESSRLASPLSEKERADEFLKDLVVKKKASAAPALSGGKAVPSVENLERIPALHDQALKLVAARKLRDAAKIYQEITLIDPDDDQAYLIMGHCYVLTGEFERAETAFQNAVHIEPSNVDEITPFYENMILNDPDDDMAYSQLGYAHLILGNLEKAKSAFEDALTINPDNPLAMSGYRIVQTAAEPTPPAQ